MLAWLLIMSTMISLHGQNTWILPIMVEEWIPCYFIHCLSCFLEGHPCLLFLKLTGLLFYNSLSYKLVEGICRLAGVWIWQTSSAVPLIRKWCVHAAQCKLNFSSHLPISWVSEFIQCTSIGGPVINYSLCERFFVHDPLWPCVSLVTYTDHPWTE